MKNIKNKPTLNYCCKDCGNLIKWWSALYGTGLCRSCSQRKDLINKRFGKLVVINQCFNKTYITENRIFWNCLCDCGNKHTVSTSNLIKGAVVSCGCLKKLTIIQNAKKRKSCKFKNVVGIRYGSIVVIAYFGKIGHKHKWYCKCDCGSFIIKNTSQLKRHLKCKKCPRNYSDHNCCKKGNEHPGFKHGLCKNLADYTRYKRYNITPEQYYKIIDYYKSMCMICGENNNSGKRLCVDHDHKTGKARGLLCDKCNRGLGYFNDDINLFYNCIKYLLKNNFESIM